MNFHPARDVRQSTFHTTADDDHPHGSFVGQYCQEQAQEITVEVILCKYSRRICRPVAWRLAAGFEMAAPFTACQYRSGSIPVCITLKSST